MNVTVVSEDRSSLTSRTDGPFVGALKEKDQPRIPNSLVSFKDGSEEVRNIFFFSFPCF